MLNGLQTNGMLLDGPVRGGVPRGARPSLVGISIDGPPAMHDAHRVDMGGKPAYDRVVRGLDVLKRHDCRPKVGTCRESRAEPPSGQRFRRVHPGRSGRPGP